MIAFRRLRTTDTDFEQRFRHITAEKEKAIAGVESAVRPILQALKERGDAALFEYTRRYDRISLDAQSVRLSPEEIEGAAASIAVEDRDALSFAADRIRAFHRRQLQQRSCADMAQDESVTEVSRPLRRVGLYVPGGKASYPSSVLMTAIPARVAGVNEIIMVSPGASPHLLTAAKIAGVDRMYRVGGAQAVAALAYGTESIPRVDKIVGPGNRYVETAKRLLFGEVGLDMVAGPSEVLIIADDSAVPAYAAADVLAQAEHDEDAVAIIIGTSEHTLDQIEGEIQYQLKETVRRDIAAKSIAHNGLMIYTPALVSAIELANRIAPEHLELMVRSPRDLLKDITAAGAIFLGNFSPAAAGDYIAGPSHVLPTGGTARFFSPLGVSDFIRHMSVVELSQHELIGLESAIQRIARLEGLDAHARAIEKRVKKH
jgi:histidinol dehydrogenase